MNEIVTERLRLRPIHADDAPALAAIYADKDVSRYLTPLTERETARQASEFVQEWDERGVGVLAVVEQATGELIGRSGLHYWPQFDETEVGWVLRRDRWGQGFATEAGSASLHWGFQRGLGLITAIIANENRASIAVASRLGMVE